MLFNGNSKINGDVHALKISNNNDKNQNNIFDMKYLAGLALITA